MTTRDDAGLLHHVELYTADLGFYDWYLGEPGYDTYFEGPERTKFEVVAPR